MTLAEPAWTTLDDGGGDPIGAALIGLAERCLRADGGMPLAVEPWFLRRRWAAPQGETFALREPGPGSRPQATALPAEALPAEALPAEALPAEALPAEALSAEALSAELRSPGVRSSEVRSPEALSSGVSATLEGGALVAAGAVCPVGDGVIVTGLVDPGARGRGLGARVLDRGLSLAGERVVTVETESLTGAAEALFASRGFERVFAEDVMCIGLGGDVAAAGWPDGVTLTGWSAGAAERFHGVYEASFRDRPGFPGEAAAEWIAEYDEDDDFRPGWSVLVADPDGDAGFVTAAAGWIVQVGVVPRARGRGLGAALVRESLARMAADGAAEAWLNVNVNNPGAAALYRRLGFAGRGRRARFQRPAIPREAAVASA